MRPIDADALINEIKKETEKAIEQDDKVGSFWLGYIAGLVIKQPTIQPQSTVGQINDNAGSTAQSTNLIDRQAAIDGKISIQRANGVEIYSDEAVPVEYLKRLPTIQPEPHEGYWIDKYPTTYICSECGWLIPDSKVKVFAYCPNCGAKMKGERQK